MGEFRVLPGTPDDDNREYLPEKIRNSDIVVNENGNNSLVYPKRLQEFHEVLFGEEPDTWFEYVPKSYDASRKVPLIIGLHGGLMTGWGHAVYTSWTLVAEREGFICVFPNAHEKRMWANYGVFDNFDPAAAPELPIVLPPEDIKDNHDMNMILCLMERMKEKYNIDEGRIFIQGMSMGNIMTGQMARNYGHLFAGAAGSGGPCELRNLYTEEGVLKNESGPLTIWQSRPEENGLPPGKEYSEYDVFKMNRIYWMNVNACDPIPQIKIDGEDNFAFYKGKHADLVYVDIKNRDHGQTLDEAFLYWDYLFSGTRRNPDGTFTYTETNLPRTGDAFGIAAADGFDWVWFQNHRMQLPTKAVMWDKKKYHGLNGGEIIRGSYLCLPLSFLAKAFGATYEASEDGAVVHMQLPDGRQLQFAKGSILCVIDETARQMYCEALHRDGELLVSAEWFAKYFFNMTVSKCEDMIYITDHFADLSKFMVDLIKDIFKDEMMQEDFFNKEGWKKNL